MTWHWIPNVVVALLKINKSLKMKRRRKKKQQRKCTRSIYYGNKCKIRYIAYNIYKSSQWRGKHFSRYYIRKWNKHTQTTYTSDNWNAYYPIFRVKTLQTLDANNNNNDFSHSIRNCRETEGKRERERLVRRIFLYQ